MNKVLNITKWIFNPFLVKKPGQVKVVVLCIAVATTFWFLNAFNKTYTTTYSYPLHYNYDEGKFIPVESLKSSVEISLTGQGWELLKEAFSLEHKTIELSLSNLPGTEVIDQSVILRSSKDILDKFEVNRIFTDSIKCNFDYKVSKLINLTLPLDSINLSNGYAIISEVKIEPSQIYITGAASVLDNVSENYVIDLHEEVDDDFDDDVEIDFPDGVISDLEEVNVVFDIAPYILIEKTLNYQVLNNSDTSLKLTPSYLDVKVYLPEIYEDQLTDSSFSIELDLTDFEYSNDTFFYPEVIEKPDFVKKVVFEDSVIQITK